MRSALTLLLAALLLPLPPQGGARGIELEVSPGGEVVRISVSGSEVPVLPGRGMLWARELTDSLSGPDPLDGVSWSIRSLPEGFEANLSGPIEVSCRSGARGTAVFVSEPVE
ncbi:MAG: hypothetical protein DRO06_04940, partial [Thermoproteota archaeon]